MSPILANNVIMEIKKVVLTAEFKRDGTVIIKLGFLPFVSNKNSLFIVVTGSLNLQLASYVMMGMSLMEMDAAICAKSNSVGSVLIIKSVLTCRIPN